MNTRRFQYGSDADAEVEELIQGMSLKSLREMAKINRQHLQYGEALSRGEHPIPPCGEITDLLADLDAEELLDWCNNMLGIILYIEQRVASQSARAGKQPKAKKARKAAAPDHAGRAILKLQALPEVQQTCVKAIIDLLSLTQGNEAAQAACLRLAQALPRIAKPETGFGNN